MLALAGTGVFAANFKSPHGDKFKLECTTCHTIDNWKQIKPMGFNHNKTNFPLLGQHKTISCRNCHKTLIFTQAKGQCASCHTDIHEGTTGRDCARCHNNNSFIVNNTNIRKIHQQQGFALVGEHASADCNRCHTSASNLRFNNIRTNCYSCHQFQYNLTNKPNHRLSGFGTDCEQCHSMVGRSWNAIGKGFNHSFFPITGMHGVLTCDRCHSDNNYQIKKSPDCLGCHSSKQNEAIGVIPAHGTLMKKYSCSDCHNVSGFNNVQFRIHDSWFGIYSGKHRGAWTKCVDCHNNDASFKANCRKCHNFDK
jgi:Cytochrome c7 and related cytochrome c